jgi:hypothetical protein
MTLMLPYASDSDRVDTPSGASPEPAAETAPALLEKMQERQHACRNIDGGYWIAEAEPAAVHHTITATPTPGDRLWAVLTTDGITNTLTHLRLTDLNHPGSSNA